MLKPSDLKLSPTSRRRLADYATAAVFEQETKAPEGRAGATKFSMACKAVIKQLAADGDTPPEFKRAARKLAEAKGEPADECGCPQEIKRILRLFVQMAVQAAYRAMCEALENVSEYLPRATTATTTTAAPAMTTATTTTAPAMTTGRSRAGQPRRPGQRRG